MLRENEFYCVKCRGAIVVNASTICARKTRNNRFQLQAHCGHCRTKLYKFISHDKYLRIMQSGKYRSCSKSRKSHRSRKSRKSRKSHRSRKSRRA